MTTFIPPRSIEPNLPFGQAAHDVLQAHIAIVHVWSPFLDKPERTHEHHQMRIAIKRLRYSIDLFHEILPDLASTIEELRLIQDALGTLHDLDEMIISIQDIQTSQKRKHYTKRHEALRTRAAECRTSLDHLLERAQHDRDAQHARCVAIWQDCLNRDVFAALQRIITTLDQKELEEPARTPLAGEAI